MEIAWSYDNLSVQNIRNALNNKDIPTNRWVLLYLYRYSMEDRADTTRELFEKHGADICNWLGSGIPLYTVFPKETFETWKTGLDYGVGDVMKKRFEYSEHYVDRETKYSIMQQLGNNYGLKEQDYPVLVVIDAKHTGFANEMYSVIRLGDNSADTVFETLKSVIEAIREHSNEPDKVLSICNKEISSSLIPVVQKLKEAKRISLERIMNVLLETHYKDVKNLYESKGDIISSMYTFSRASYFNYLKKDRMPFEAALEFALELRISVEEFDHLLDFTEATYTQKRKWREGTDKRYKAIKYCMEEKMGFYDTNEYLEQHNFKIIGEGKV